MEVEEVIKTIEGELSRIFRHLVPGVYILGIAYLSHPKWISWITLDNGTHLIIQFVLSIAVGNFWYILHRYTLHNLLDYICYKYRRHFVNLGLETDDSLKYSKNYWDWLSNHIRKNFHQIDARGKKLKEFVFFRSSQIHLLFIASEALFVFSIWREEKSFIDINHNIGIILSIVIFFASCIQYCVSNKFDIDVVNEKPII